MTIDERLERLTERHEALTESVEILTGDLHALQTLVGTLARATRKLQKDNSRLDGLVTEIAEGTTRLLHVAQLHEQRLDRLEGQHPTA
jgi:chromosome segregation ATPase